MPKKTTKKVTQYKFYNETEIPKVIYEDEFLNYFLSMIQQYGQSLNVWTKILYETKSNIEDAGGSLTSQCAQTSNLINVLCRDIVSQEEVFILEKKIKEKEIVKLPSGKVTKLYDDKITCPIYETIYDRSDFFNTIYRIISEIQSKKIKTYVNLSISVEPTGPDGFPGHIFNIIISPFINTVPGVPLNTLCNIYIVQSFIYKYYTKVFYTNDITDLYAFFNIYCDIFAKEPGRRYAFSSEDAENAKKIFGVPLENYRGQSLIGSPKEVGININYSYFTEKSVLETFSYYTLRSDKLVKKIKLLKYFPSNQNKRLLEFINTLYIKLQQGLYLRYFKPSDINDIIQFIENEVNQIETILQDFYVCLNKKNPEYIRLCLTRKYLEEKKLSSFILLPGGFITTNLEEPTHGLENTQFLDPFFTIPSNVILDDDDTNFEFLKYLDSIPNYQGVSGQNVYESTNSYGYQNMYNGTGGSMSYLDMW
jgi:hypothetical protein